MSNSDLSKIRVEAKTSTRDMMIGPPVISAILSGVLTLAVAPHIQKHLNFLWLLPMFFVPLLFATFYYNLNRGRWLIENGIVYRGKKPLFRLDEIEAVQIGLPDNWITAISKLPVKVRGSGGMEAAAISQAELIVLRLTNRRWMMWSGLMYTNFHKFRSTLFAAAPFKTIEPLPQKILPKLKLWNVNKILYE